MIQLQQDPESVSFENFAMLLNLINNVYIKNNILAKSSTQVIDEEEEGSEKNMRPFGFVDSFNRFMALSQAEVDKIYQKFLPLMSNKRMNQRIGGKDSIQSKLKQSQSAQNLQPNQPRPKTQKQSKRKSEILGGPPSGSTSHRQQQRKEISPSRRIPINKPTPLN